MSQYRQESAELTRAAANCQSSTACQQLAGQLKANSVWLEMMANAFTGKDPQRASLYRHEANAAQQDYLQAINRMTDHHQGLGSGWNTGQSGVITVQGLAPGKPYADYEIQNQQRFGVMASSVLLPAAGGLVAGSAVANSMLTAGAIGAGFDAAGQYTLNCMAGNCNPGDVRLAQSLFAGNTAMIAGPLVGPVAGTIQQAGVNRVISQVISAGSLGFATAFTNTSFNNVHFGEDKNAFIAGSLGAVAGAAGAGASSLLLTPSAEAWQAWQQSLSPSLSRLVLAPPPPVPPKTAAQIVETVISNSPSFVNVPDNQSEVIK